MEHPDPVRVVIPAIGVDAPVVPLGLNPDGSLEVPTAFHEAGWWEPGAEPGERGAAVLAGHLDSRSGPAVFYRLRELEREDVVEIRRMDGSAVRFRIERVEQYGKEAFPTDLVYARTVGATLRLVTCGGDFDFAAGHYRDNTVAFAAPLPVDVTATRS